MVSQIVFDLWQWLVSFRGWNFCKQNSEVVQTLVDSVHFHSFHLWLWLLMFSSSSRCIRIWLMGIFKPLITLKYHMSPVYCASWSTVHSSIIVALHRDTVDVWDLRRSILQPASSTRIDSTAYYTTLRWVEENWQRINDLIIFFISCFWF